MEKSRASYLLLNEPPSNTEVCATEVCATEVCEFQLTDNSAQMYWLKDFLSAAELEPIDAVLRQIRQTVQFKEDQTVGTVGSYKYIAHHPGRYDIWNIQATIKRPPGIPAHLQQQSIGCLFLDAHTNIAGKWHKDTTDLFPKVLANSQLPPFYYNMLIATVDQTDANGPTQFILNEKMYWVPLKRGDALVFDGELTHRGTTNNTAAPRDLVYAIFTPPWYAEEIL
jgi:hypothetical protein